jgi:transposase
METTYLLFDYQFKTLARHESNPRTRVRLLALAHLKEGKSQAATAAMLCICRQTVNNWYRNFKHEGLSGLKDKPKPGQPKILASSDEPKLKQMIKELGKRHGGSISAKEIQTLLHEQFHADYSLPGVYFLLHRLRLSWVSPRSVHPKTDPEKQQRFKKNSLKKR